MYIYKNNIYILYIYIYIIYIYTIYITKKYKYPLRFNSQASLLQFPTLDG